MAETIRLLMNNAAYILIFIAAAAALLEFAKDWQEHRTRRRRLAVLVLIIAALVFSFINVHQDETARLRLEGETKGGQDTAVQAIGNLSQKVGNLQTQIKTEDLRKQAESLQAELKATQKALAPPPKAKLQFSFSPVPFTWPGQPFKSVRETMLPVRPDKSVHVEFTLENDTTVEAERVQILVQICDSCKYAKEPVGCVAQDALKPTQRECDVDHIVAKGNSAAIALDIIPPPTIEMMQIGVMYRCHTCIVPDWSRGTIHFSHQ